MRNAKAADFRPRSTIRVNPAKPLSDDTGMRLVIDSLIVVMVLGVLGGILYLNRQDERSQMATADVIEALDRLHEQTRHHTAIETAVAGRDTIVVQVMPGWFGERLPVNILVGPEQPWIDLAPPGDKSSHPPDPVITRQDQAGFWYNPTTGVFRARVEPQLSEGKTLELYNHLNGTDLDAFEQAPDPARQPLAYTPGLTPAISYASPAAEWVENSDTAELETPSGSVRSHVEPTHERPAVQDLYEEPILIEDLDTPAPTEAVDPTDDPGVDVEVEPEDEPEPAPRPTLPRANAGQ